MKTEPLDTAERSLEYCTYCPKLCRHACPVSNAEPREAIIPQQKMQTANLLRKGHLPWQPTYTEPVYACTGCGACTEACAHEIEPGVVLVQARESAEARRAGHPALADLPNRFRRRGATLTARLAEQAGATQKNPAAQVAFHPACQSIGTEDLPRALRLIGRLSSSMALLQTEDPCAGYPLWAAGLRDPFRAHARRFAEAARGHRSLVSSCAACVHLMRSVYPREGIKLAPQVSHLVEWIDRRFDDLPWPRQPSERSAVYQDPCFLGRIEGVYDAPRRLLARVAKVREFSRSRAEAECSGGGGLVPVTMPDTARAMARRRLREVAPGELVVTACATCQRQLAGAGADAVDLVTLLERTFQGEGEG